MKVRLSVVFAVLAVLVCAIILLMSRSVPSKTEVPRVPDSALHQELRATPAAPTREANGDSSDQDAATRVGAVAVGMNDTEFSRLKVSLPASVNKPWKGPFYDSATCFHPRNKSIAVRVLPGWIRKAVIAGELEMAGRFLWSYLKFMDDPDPEIATAAVIGLYRMGDYNNSARNQMRKWIEDGFQYSYSDSTAAGDSKDIRAQVLEELELNNDRSVDQSIYDTWLKTKAQDGEDFAGADYAYYLEKSGRELPADYWMQRLDNPSGFANALEIAEKKGTPEVTAKLQGIFEQLRARPAASADAGRAASVASALFRQTGDAAYRDYLAEQARTQLASGSFESSLPKVLDGLAATNDKAALEVVSTAMQHENAVIRELAIDALGKARDPAAAELLFEAAIQKAKEGKGFPAREMRALLAQGDPSADSKYERLQQALLSGQLGWSATTSDFESLEFFRKHRRQ